ncbi:MAG: molecular chaperone HtpG [Myxococcales bacterium]|nr:molecular chaperone HtpG [Myxococcales bacterium]
MAAVEHGFKAEVQQLLNLMIHSVYSDREVFLRELVSNAADALDKARFLGLTDKDLVPAVGESEAIRITVDGDAETITIDDDGIGMTRDEIVENLGTIAHSGTKAFLEQQTAQAEEGGAPKLIGQFGLGFYSAFMVAHEVEVVSRSAQPDAQPVRWTSKGEGTYTLEEGEREHRGTSITLHLREDCADFGEVEKLKNVVRKHSNFLPWPIEVDGDQANSGKALWVEPPSQVTDDEANAFYKSVAVDWQDPARRIHVSVDSPLQYSALLFVPQVRPFDLFHPEAARGPRLYARRVLIEEHAKALLPEWLRFVRGVVDSEDIALNVSREMVQKTAVVRKISEALTKRILKDLGKWSRQAEPEPVPEEGGDDSDEAPVEAPPSYADFWRNFGVLLKEGYYHARAAWGDELLPLLRFNALSHDDETGLMSLSDYKAAMPEEQDTIWFLTAESRSSALASPHLEAFRKRGWDVLLLTDPVDEWLVSALDAFDEVPLKSVSRGELDLEDESEEAAEDKADMESFTPWVKELLGDHVADVRESSRLTDSAVVLVDADDGMSANMERLLRESQQAIPGIGSKRILELNPRHPLIRNLAEMRDKGHEETAAQIARMLYDDALLLEGTVTEPAAMGKRLQDLLTRASEAALG